MISYGEWACATQFACGFGLASRPWLFSSASFPSDFLRSTALPCDLGGWDANLAKLSQQAFDLAISAGQLPPRPWGSSDLSPDQAARLILSHTLQTPDGPFLFSPSVTDPFSSSYTDGQRVSTAVGVSGGTGVEVGVRVIELGSRSTTPLALEVVDKEIFVNEAR